MSEQVIVCLGNANPKRYLQDVPKPAHDATLEEVREFVAGRLGPEAIKSYEGHKDERVILLDLNEQKRDLDPEPWTGGKVRTKIKFSPSSTPSQMLKEAVHIWRKHAHEKPLWVSGTDEAVVSMIAREFGVDEVREYMEDGI